MSEHCFIATCIEDIVDNRGMVYTRDGRSYFACTPHWNAISEVLDQQYYESRWVETAGHWRPELLEES